MVGAELWLKVVGTEGDVGVFVLVKVLTATDGGELSAPVNIVNTPRLPEVEAGELPPTEPAVITTSYNGNAFPDGEG